MHKKFVFYEINQSTYGSRDANRVNGKETFRHDKVQNTLLELKRMPAAHLVSSLTKMHLDNRVVVHR